ncbi:outer membrane protein assembly factor BamA [Sphingomonas rosea]|uniref:Outer membrane protein assembly factor BamA n=1 Tax=Sphingomonas rosea TaxID=335605 RepID=A0ABP7UFF2_9SPHN
MSSHPNKALVRRTQAALLLGTIIGGWASPALAQQAATTAQPAPAAPTTTTAAPAAAAPVQQRIIRSVAVRGAQRLEPETVRSYAGLNPGEAYDAEKLDTAIKALYDTELFRDAQIEGADTGNLVIVVQENPVINRIVLEGNKRLKEDKILPEIRLAPRQIFTRSKVRSDVERIIELYKRQGRFGARVEPKTVNLDQNRVDLVFEITEGDLSKVRAINIIGNEQFPDSRLRKEMYTRQAGGALGFLKSNDTYDPDRLAADQQKLRAFYLTEGYADFRVVSALAELTPDRRDFVITYVVEEGPRYKFGDITAESELRDLKNDVILKIAGIKKGDWFNAKAIEDAVTRLNESAGLLGYAFTEIDPAYDRQADTKTMNIAFRVGETPRTYVDKVNISGNTGTRDKVIRREFRLNEGDAFNTIKVKRSQDRIQSLGYFQEKLEIKQDQVAPDRVALNVDVEEKPTGQLQVSAGYSSLERFILALSVEQNNFRGMGQSLSAGINYSRYSKSIQLGFTEPYFLDKSILLGGQLYRRDFNSFNYIGNTRNTTYSQNQTGGGFSLGFPVNEYVNFGLRYTLNLDDITLDKATFYTNGVCDPQKAGQYLCDEIGKRTTSLLGYSLVFDNTNGVRATRGQRLVLSQDFAGLGGDVRYIRTRGEGAKFWGIGRSGFILSARAEGGIIQPLQKAKRVGVDPIRISDRFFTPQLRGFDLRGIGPRIRRTNYTGDGSTLESTGQITDALGGRAYYFGRVELEIPLGAGARGLGLRPSVYVDAGSLFKLKRPNTIDIPGVCSFVIPAAGTVPGSSRQVILNPGQTQANCGTAQTGETLTFSPLYREDFLGNSASPRLSIGVGVNWNSPFGPLRIDLAKALLKQDGDDTKLFQFNVGTQF